MIQLVVVQECLFQQLLIKKTKELNGETLLHMVKR